MWSDFFGTGGASSYARQVDLLSIFLLGLCVLFTLAVCASVLWFSIQFRAREGPRAARTGVSRGWALLWTLAPLAGVLAVFSWGRVIEAGHDSAPEESIRVSGSGRQWMWRFRHEDGPTEINALHVPIHVPVAIQLESEDVIHRLSLPAFRVQQDVLPGMKTQFWFLPDREGSFPMGCTEFCGTGHSTMGGMVYVLDPMTYEHWVTGETASLTPEQAGELLFAAFRCDSCHAPGGEGSGPALANRFGAESRFVDGSAAAFDEAYARQSLLEPNVKVVEGYQPMMPSYKGQLDESQIGQMIVYLKSLGDG